MHDFPLERYLQIRSAYGASISPNGTLAFLLDTTGVAQIWTLERAQGWPEQRTFYDEPVSFVSFSPVREELIFGMDEGGNERLQFYRLDDSGAVVELTALPSAKHRFGGWSHDGNQFAFASNRRDERVFDVYVQGRDGTEREATCVYEGEGWLSVAGWRPDDGALIVHESAASFDQDVSVLDLDSGECRLLTDETDEVRYRSPEWAPDGDGIYLVSDAGSDTTYLAYVDVSTGNLECVRQGGEYNIDGVAVDPDSGVLVYSRNVEGDTELTVCTIDGPTALSTLAKPDLPGRIAGGVSFDPAASNGYRFALSSSGRTINTNVSVVTEDALDENGDTTTPTIERWTNASTVGIPRETFVDAELIRYPTFDDRTIPALFSLPDEVLGEGSADDVLADDSDGVPVIVDIHGGPESQRRPSFSGVRQYYLSRGYALFEPNVRGSTGYGREYMHLDDVERRMDSVRDVGAAIEWLAEHQHVDSNRIIAKGGSYGGFMVLASLTEYPARFAAGVSIVGITSFVTFLENTGSWRRALREREYGSLEEDRELLESISPINRIDRLEAPLLVIHGANDPRVPVSEARQLAETAADRGIPVETLIFDDEGHGIAKRENQLDAHATIDSFLDEHVD